MKLFGKEIDQKRYDGYGSEFMNQGEIKTEMLKEEFPEFYEDFKDLIDSGKIIYIYECWCLEGGVILNVETKETIFIDYRC